MPSVGLCGYKTHKCIHTSNRPIPKKERGEGRGKEKEREEGERERIYICKFLAEWRYCHRLVLHLKTLETSVSNKPGGKGEVMAV